MTLYRWDDVKKEQLTDTLSRRFVHGVKGMIAQLWLAKGTTVPRHIHEAEQLTYVVDGHLRLWLGGEGDEKMFDVRSGEVLVIPPNVPHRAEAIAATYDMDIFAPPREDWIKGQDAYLRGR